MAVVSDPNGNLHVAAAGSGPGNRGIWYLTNAGGRWTAQQVTTPPPSEWSDGEEADGAPVITLDNDGSVWIGFARWECWQCAPNPSIGTFYVTNSPGAWSQPVPIAGDETTVSDMIVRDGLVHVAFDEGMTPMRSYPVWYGTDASGEWTVERVARDGGAHQLVLGDDGRPRIYFTSTRNYDAVQLMLATQTADGRFDIEPVPGAPREGVPLVDPFTGELVGVAWGTFDVQLDAPVLRYSERAGGEWSDPMVVRDHASLNAFVIGPSETVNLLMHQEQMEVPAALFLLSKPLGATEFEASSIMPDGGWYSTLAVDPAGRPHVFVALEQTYGALDKVGIWYTAGPPHE